MPFNKWAGKLSYTHKREYYTAMKKNGLMRHMHHRWIPKALCRGKKPVVKWDTQHNILRKENSRRLLSWVEVRDGFTSERQWEEIFRVRKVFCFLIVVVFTWTYILLRLPRTAPPKIKHTAYKFKKKEVNILWGTCSSLGSPKKKKTPWDKKLGTRNLFAKWIQESQVKKWGKWGRERRKPK